MTENEFPETLRIPNVPNINIPSEHLGGLFREVTERYKKHLEGKEFYERDGKKIKSLTNQERDDIYEIFYNITQNLLLSHTESPYQIPYQFYGFNSISEFDYFFDELKDFSIRMELRLQPQYKYYENLYLLDEQRKISGEIKVEETPIKKQLLYIKLEEENGSIVRVLSLFNRRNYNIESMTFSPSIFPGILNMVLLVVANDDDFNKIVRQLKKLIPVVLIQNLTDRPTIDRELILVKIKAEDPIYTRTKLTTLLNGYESKIIDSYSDIITLEFVGDSGMICNIERILKQFDVIDIVRSGIIAFSRESNMDSDFLNKKNISRSYLFGKNQYQNEYSTRQDYGFVRNKQEAEEKEIQDKIVFEKNLREEVKQKRLKSGKKFIDNYLRENI